MDLNACVNLSFFFNLCGFFLHVSVSTITHVPYKLLVLN